MSETSGALGHMIIQEGNVVKADGELANAERLASLIQRIALVGGGSELLKDSAGFESLTLAFPTYQLVITRNGQQIVVVKRPPEPGTEDILGTNSSL
ncbi:unnamed protein product [Bursaphelenchus xylophilus]|uniref:(pine wood nematode) hypothetical protein n=1 Tax=Bursaphelenchus xylophilus TaxID=6326 RepID=A0A1I7SHN5_BURXY|nr:unnamed protein product [Bursaphelenchus xylophilus]CAG9129140.1 unnamed protein product [Bursaphelenchus xylophilus]